MTAPCPTLGFIVTMETGPAVGTAAWNQLWDEWIDVLEQRGLYCGGGGGDCLEYVVAGEASQATDADREVVREWLAQCSDIRAWRVGPLEDLEQEQPG
jgi:uncharacterized protein YggL (DUF469 family)